MDISNNEWTNSIAFALFTIEYVSKKINMFMFDTASARIFTHLKP